MKDQLPNGRLLALLAWIVATPAVAQQPPRDLPRPGATGTATIAGSVVTDDAQAKPLRRARITLNAPELPVGRTVISNDDGTFAFERLPPGRYTVAGSKDAYVAMSYGARRTGRWAHASRDAGELGGGDRLSSVARRIVARGRCGAGA